MSLPDIPEHIESENASEPSESLVKAQYKDEAVIKPAANILSINSLALGSVAPFKGRRADKAAGIISLIAMGAALWLASLFFAGFVANDYHAFAVISSFALSVFLAAYAVIPLGLLTVFARRAYKDGGTAKLYGWCLLLIIPWVALGILCLLFTPLPVWIGVSTVMCGVVLLLWAAVSLCLEFRGVKG